MGRYTDRHRAPSTVASTPRYGGPSAPGFPAVHERASSPCRALRDVGRQLQKLRPSPGEGSPRRGGDKTQSLQPCHPGHRRFRDEGRQQFHGDSTFTASVSRAYPVPEPLQPLGDAMEAENRRFQSPRTQRGDAAQRAYPRPDLEQPLGDTGEYETRRQSPGTQRGDAARHGYSGPVPALPYEGTGRLQAETWAAPAPIRVEAGGQSTAAADLQDIDARLLSLQNFLMAAKAPRG